VRDSVMILGAGVYQLPLIRKVKERGFRAVVVSMNGNYPGIPEADVFLPIDTTNVAAAVAAAKEYRIRAAVTTGTDVGVPTLGAINDALSLPGISEEAATIISHKHRFRQFQNQNDLPHPRFVVSGSWTSLRDVLATLSVPFYVKPVDSSGSRGITRINSHSLKAVETAFDFAKSFSRVGAVCCEAEIAGIEVGGNAVLFDGELVFLAITQKHMDGVVVRGHSFPTGIPLAGQEAVRHSLHAHARALNLPRGILNFDIIVDQQSAHVIELVSWFSVKWKRRSVG